MKKDALVTCFWLMLLLSMPTFSQDLQHVSAKAEEAFRQRVKILDEFCQRFNGEEVVLSRSFVSEQAIERKAVILSLFDQEYIQNISDTAIVQQFVNQVVHPQKPVTISYYDEGWYARSAWEATLDGSPVSLTLNLITEYEPGKIKWSIAAVQADFLKETVLKGETLSPVSHDFDFMQLKKALKAGGDLTHYATKHHQNKSLAKFFALIESGRLQLLHASRPIYVFTQIAGWEFEVHYFERSGYNTGWRIARLTPKELKARNQQY